MPFIYFVAAAVGVIAATVVASVVKTHARFRRVRQQMTLETEQQSEEYPHSQEPAAMTSTAP
jgi:hypothetical protein